MPVSDIANIPAILNEVMRLQPASIMDIGVGFGKYGVLCREVLEASHGRCKKGSWRVEICGIEGFRKYNNPAWNLYNSVAVVELTTMYAEIAGWDLVLALDVLEHFDKPVAMTILQHLVSNNRNVIVSVPLGVCPQGACFGNELERHRSTWDGEEFWHYNSRKLHQGVCYVASIRGEKQLEANNA